MFNFSEFYTLLSFALFTLFLTSFLARKCLPLWVLSFVLFTSSFLVYDLTSFSSDLNRFSDFDQLLSLSSSSFDKLFYTPLIFLLSTFDPKIAIFLFQFIALIFVYLADYFFYSYFKRSYSLSLSLGSIAFSYLSLFGIYSLFGQLRLGIFYSYLLFVVCFSLYSRSSWNIKSLLTIPLHFLHFNSSISLSIPYFVYLLSKPRSLKLIKFKSFLSRKLFNIPLFVIVVFLIVALCVPILPDLLPTILSRFSVIVNAVNVQLLYYISESSSSISSLNRIWLVTLYSISIFLLYRKSYLPFPKSILSSILIILTLSLPAAFTYIYSRLFYLYAYTLLITCSSLLLNFNLRRYTFFLFLILFYLRFDSFFILL